MTWLCTIRPTGAFEKSIRVAVIVPGVAGEITSITVARFLAPKSVAWQRHGK